MKKYQLRRAIRKYAKWEQDFTHSAKAWGSLIDYAASDIISNLPDDFDLEDVILIEAIFAHPNIPLRYLPSLAFGPFRAFEEDEPMPICAPEPITVNPVSVGYGHGKHARLYLQLGIAAARRDEIMERYLFIWPLAGKQ